MFVSHTQEIDKEYAKALDAATDLDALRSAVALYGEVSRDALLAVELMNSDDFKTWRLALKLERSGQFMGEELANRFGAILMPEVMMRISMIATQFHVPWGVAYHRLKDLGKLKIGRNRFAVLTQ